MTDATPEKRHYDPSEAAEEASVVILADPEPSNVAPESDAEASTTTDNAPQRNTTAAANDDEINITNSYRNVNDSSTVVANGLSSMLSSVIRNFDSRAEDTDRSQDQLSFALDRLTRELDQLLEDAPLPFIMQHAVKISGVRKRVSSLNTLLKSVQRRIDNIDRMLSVGLLHEKAASESARQK